jgi:hypothetical protein
VKRPLLVALLLLTGLTVIWSIWIYLALQRPASSTETSSTSSTTSASAELADALHIPVDDVAPTTSEPLIAEDEELPLQMPQSQPEVTPTPQPTPEIVYLPDRVDPPNPKEKTVAARLRQYGADARDRMKPHFEEAGVTYPPAKLLFVALKQEGLLKVYAASAGRNRPFQFVFQYPIVAAGVFPGPKLREGDLRTPEGIYRITMLNPTSSYHLSMALNYPNKFDWQQAKRDKRTKPGSDIMIHGFYLSDGCLAMGDTAATDLFVLVADTGLANCEVILSPVDFRVTGLPEDADVPSWTTGLYDEIRERLARIPDGTSTESKLIRYTDARRPEPVKPAADSLEEAEIETGGE